MNAFLLIAHGSRIKESNDEIFRLTKKLKTILNDRFDIIDSSFMVNAEPDCRQKIQEYIDNGVIEIVVLPYFLALGRHVLEDIMLIVENFRKNNPKVNIYVAPHIGASTEMTSLINKHIDSLKK